MANFSNNAITDVGRTLLSHVQMGAVFTPTKIVMGSGSLPAGTTPRTIKEVVTPFKNLTINKKKRGNDGTVTYGGVFSNQDLSTDTYFRELALYAKAVYPDGQEVAECLYSYGNAGSTADLLPAYSSGQPVERQIDLVVYIGSDAAVDLTIPSGIYVTQEQMAEALSTLAEATVFPSASITIPTSGWTAGTAGDYAYYIDIAAADITAADGVDVVLTAASISTAQACGLCPSVETRAGALRFRAVSIPGGSMTGEYRILRGEQGGEKIWDMAQ